MAVCDEIAVMTFWVVLLLSIWSLLAASVKLIKECFILAAESLSLSMVE